jgi:hypothetical protein
MDGGLADGYQHFREILHLHLQGRNGGNMSVQTAGKSPTSLHGITTQKTTIHISTAMNISQGILAMRG